MTPTIETNASLEKELANPVVVAKTENTVTERRLVSVSVKTKTPEGKEEKTKVFSEFSAEFPLNPAGALDLMSREGNATFNGKTLEVIERDEKGKELSRRPMTYGEFYVERLSYGIDSFFRAPVSNAIRAKYGDNEKLIAKKVDQLQEARLKNGKKPLSAERARQIVLIQMGLIDDED